MNTQFSSNSRLRLEEVEQFHEAGFLGPFTLCSPQRAEELCKYILSEVLATPGPNLSNEYGKPDNCSCRHLDNKTILEFCTRPELLDRVESIIGKDLVIFLSRFWIKLPSGGIIPWHQDATYWHIYPRITASVWIALTEANQLNGCLEFMPVSHKIILPQVKTQKGMRWDLMTDPQHIDESKAVPMKLAPGQFVIFDANTLHRTGDNVSGETRIGLSVHITVPFVRIERDWFFKGHQGVLVRGEDHIGINQLIHLYQAAC